MILSPSDSQLFYKLMWGLHFYVNTQKGIVENVASAEKYADLLAKKKAEVREALWNQPELIDAFVQENPHHLSADELNILRKWRARFLKDRFYILRHLKKGTIFIGSKNRVYSVIGLLTELDEVIPSYALPHMVEAILLPFKGAIIYDGLLPGYNVHFGSGIRADFNRTYAAAKEKGRIIATLEPDLAPQKSAAPKGSKDLLPKLEELTAAASALKGRTSLQNAALALARASLDLAMAASKEEDLQPHERSLRRAITRLFNLLEIMDEE